jgi:hypothetical protein
MPKGEKEANEKSEEESVVRRVSKTQNTGYTHGIINEKEI